jgi:hypothetical protein
MGTVGPPPSVESRARLRITNCLGPELGGAIPGHPAALPLQTVLTPTPAAQAPSHEPHPGIRLGQPCLGARRVALDGRVKMRPKGPRFMGTAVDGAHKRPSRAPRQAPGTPSHQARRGDARLWRGGPGGAPAPLCPSRPERLEGCRRRPQPPGKPGKMVCQVEPCNRKLSFQATGSTDAPARVWTHTRTLYAPPCVRSCALYHSRPGAPKPIPPVRARARVRQTRESHHHMPPLAPHLHISLHSKDRRGTFCLCTLPLTPVTSDRSREPFASRCNPLPAKRACRVLSVTLVDDLMHSSHV